MSSDISQSFTDVTDALSLERKAMAHARRDAEKRLFAVVMGSSLPRWCRPSGEWDVRTEVLADGPLTAALWQGADPNNTLAHDLLTDAVSDYVTKVAEQIRDGIVADIQAYIPEFDPDDSANAYGLLALSALDSQNARPSSVTGSGVSGDRDDSYRYRLSLVGGARKVHLHD